MFSLTVWLLWSEWQYGYNRFMALPRGQTLQDRARSVAFPEPLSAPTVITPDAPRDGDTAHLRDRISEIEKQIGIARISLPNVDSCASTLIPLVDAIEELLYDIGYSLDFEGAFENDSEPTFKKMKPNEGYNPDDSYGLSQGREMDE